MALSEHRSRSDGMCNEILRVSYRLFQRSAQSQVRGDRRRQRTPGTVRCRRIDEVRLECLFLRAYEQIVYGFPVNVRIALGYQVPALDEYSVGTELHHPASGLSNVIDRGDT